MRVICDSRDQDLLFLSQGLLGGVRKLLLAMHVQRCPACRARLEEFGHTSSALTSAMGCANVLDRPRPTPSLRRLVLVATVVLLAAFGLATILRSILPSLPDEDPFVTVPAGECIPEEGKPGPDRPSISSDVHPLPGM